MRGVECELGRATAIVPSDVAERVLLVEVTSPLPLTREFVLGMARWEHIPLVVFGFRPLQPGRSAQRVLLLTEDQSRRLRVGLHVDAVRRLRDVGTIGASIAKHGAGSFFRTAQDTEGVSVRILDVTSVSRHVFGGR